MPAIQLHDLSLATPDGRELVSNLNFTFGPRRTGIVGRNGTGKTTLLRVIVGEATPRSGSVHVDGSIGVLRQKVAIGRTSVAAALGVAGELARLARVETGGASDIDYANADWSLHARIPQALAATGLPPLDLDREIGTLSGGQQTRLSLAALLLQRPDMLLLDEPTNNLDADGRQAVRELLRNWRGGAIIVSHDREVLAEVDDIVELTSIGGRSYGGNWDVYEARRALDLAAAEHDAGDAERRVEEIDRKAQERAERQARSDARGARTAKRGGAPRILLGGLRRAAEETAAAKSRLADRQRGDASTRLVEAKARIEVLQPLTVTLAPTGLPMGRVVLQLDRVSGGYGDKPVIRDLSLTVTGPERVAITGPNGSGKSTLLRLVTGDLAETSGSVRITPRHAMLDQLARLLDPAESIRENYRRLNPADSENDCRAALARFKFRAEAALQRVGSLSGGETLRAALAVTIGAATPPELLILDEPTNHLDLDAIAAVEAGLRAYDGALLVVSHDIAFLDAIGIDREVPLA